MKAFQSVLHVLFILCYNLLQVFLSLIFDLMRVRNTREKDITRERIRVNSLASRQSYQTASGLYLLYLFALRLRSFSAALKSSVDCTLSIFCICPKDLRLAEPESPLRAG